MNFKAYLSDISTLIKFFFKKCNGTITFLMGIVITSFFTGMTEDNSFIFFLIGLIVILVIIIYFIYFSLNVYVSIEAKNIRYSLWYSKHPKKFSFKIPSLMLDNSFSTELVFEVKITEFFKNEINSKKQYTLVVEKDKSISVFMSPEYVEDNDMEYSNINDKFYYFVQDYENQKVLKFNLNFSGTTKINFNNNCKIYLECGDVHNKNNKFKNKIFDKEFFKTRLDTITQEIK